MVSLKRKASEEPLLYDGTTEEDSSGEEEPARGRCARSPPAIVLIVPAPAIHGLFHSLHTHPFSDRTSLYPSSQYGMHTASSTFCIHHPPPSLTTML